MAPIAYHLLPVDTTTHQMHTHHLGRALSKRARSGARAANQAMRAASRESSAAMLLVSLAPRRRRLRGSSMTRVTPMPSPDQPSPASHCCQPHVSSPSKPIRLLCIPHGMPLSLHNCMLALNGLCYLCQAGMRTDRQQLLRRAHGGCACSRADQGRREGQAGDSGSRWCGKQRRLVAAIQQVPHLQHAVFPARKKDGCGARTRCERAGKQADGLAGGQAVARREAGCILHRVQSLEAVLCDEGLLGLHWLHV
jgi:hypothetical protein